VAEAERRGCHVIGYAEGCAALARRGRELHLPPQQIEELGAEFSDVWHGLDVIDVHQPLVHRAGALAVQHRLRGLECLHLAPAERVGEGAEFRFAVFDARLPDAARALGMRLLQS
jgi:predicted nucleic acid-binding protein